MTKTYSKIHKFSFEMEDIQFLTHCTKSHLKERIQEGNVLKKCPTPKIWQEPLAQDGAPGGVWFGVTLRDSILPTMSPFGTERVLKPVESLQKDLVCYNHALYLEAIRFEEKITNVRLILLKGDDDENINWCEEQYENGCLYSLEKNNPFLTIIPESGKWIWKTMKNGERPHTWVSLFIPRDVDVTDCGWDTVEQYKFCTQCNQSGHSNPECPMAVCFKCGGLGHWVVNCHAWDTFEDVQRFCTQCNQSGHSNPECPMAVCFKCGGLGHWAVNCPLNSI